MSIDKVLIAEEAGPVNAAADLGSLGAARPTTPHFRRNHFPTPPIDPDGWTLALGGAMSEAMLLPAVSLRAVEPRTLPAVLECAGHRRAELDPPAPGLPWRTGAVSEAVWTGASLGDVLRRAGIAPEAVEIVLRGADHGESEHGGVRSYARSLPVAKALHPDTLLAYEMNGELLTDDHGAPLRLVSTVKYGIKQIKRIGKIEFTNERPADFWAESGYDWYSGH